MSRSVSTKSWMDAWLLPLTMLSVGAGLFLVIKTGFAVSGDRAPYPISDPIVSFAAAVILMAALLVGAGNLRKSIIKWRARRQAVNDARVRTAAWHEAKRVRAQLLASNPDTAAYAELVLRGEPWSDEQIAYDRNPAAAATCAHLNPIELAIRRAGIPVKLDRDLTVTARCKIEATELVRIHGDAPPVRYAEYYISERGGDDIPAAFLICDEHKSVINTLHPAEFRARDAAVYPANAPGDIPSGVIGVTL